MFYVLIPDVDIDSATLYLSTVNICDGVFSSTTWVLLVPYVLAFDSRLAYSARSFITNLVEMDEHLFHLDNLVDRVAC